MSMLLIGGDSYVGRSITSDFEKMGKSVSTFSSKKIFSKYSYAELDSNTIDSHDFAVVIGTPGHFRSNFNPSDKAKILKRLSESKINVYVISTIHTVAEKFVGESKYIRVNRDFEEIALLNDFRVVRIPNFIGVIPESHENQARLLPWSLLDNYLKFGFLQINSNLESEFEWITSLDLCNAILILENCVFRNVDLQPGYKCTLEDFVRTFVKFAAEKRNTDVSIQELNHENVRKVIAGHNPIGALGWKTELTGKMFHNYIGEYLHKNWSQNA
jgi:hypothetical protein